MCLQCTADAQPVFKTWHPLLPKSYHGGPYYLVRARTGCEDWPSGWYGLVLMNDPEIIWEWTPEPEPKAEDFGAWYKNIDALQKKFVFGPLAGHQLVCSCMEAGYDPKVNGYNLLCWLMDYIGKKIKTRKLATEEDWGPPVFPALGTTIGEKR